VDCICCLTIVSHQGSRHVALAFSEDGSTTLWSNSNKAGCPLRYASFFLVLRRAQELQSACMVQAVRIEATSRM
jgi:hypothetical protein